MNIEIDKNSGFCFGVVNAINKAEQHLSDSPVLYCLGDIVHNTVEVNRLKEAGLVTVDREQFKQLKNCRVLLRAHGEPPETYQIARENNVELIDATCPVVLKLQHRIKLGYDEMTKNEGQLVIYGKHGHAEVVGLVGQTKGKAIVISGENDLAKIDYSKPVAFYSQTTKSLENFTVLAGNIKEKMQEVQGNEQVNFTFNDTICRQVYNRYKTLKEFSQKHDVVVFVTDPKSSNGKVLYDICKNENELTYLIADADEIQKDWFIGVNSVGVCGATSTPRWLMEKVSDKIGLLTN